MRLDGVAPLVTDRTGSSDTPLQIHLFANIQPYFAKDAILFGGEERKEKIPFQNRKICQKYLQQTGIVITATANLIFCFCWVKHNKYVYTKKNSVDIVLIVRIPNLFTRV